jgi:hypothetical protein
MITANNKRIHGETKSVVGKVVKIALIPERIRGMKVGEKSV